ncbi:putative histidine kinase-like protein M3YPp, partial [Aureobasidium melanogenum]
MNNSSAALLVASLLTDLKPQELPTVTRVLDFLGIHIANSNSSPTAKTRLCISIAHAYDNAPVQAAPDDDSTGNDATEERATGVEFDLDARWWKLKPAAANHDDNSDSDTSRGPSPPSCPSSASTSAPLVLPNVSNSKSKEQDATDWTIHIPDSEHNRLLINTRWDKTELGPIRSWPPVLQLMVLKMLGDPRPANLYWGSGRIAIYNQAFSIMAHSRHPAMMGSTAEAAMPATWPFLKPMMQQVEDTKRAFHMPEFEMEVHKESGFLEEAWYDGVFSPILDCDGSFQGLYNSGYEITDKVLMHRYARLTNQMAAVPDFHHTKVWVHIVDACRSFERDVPMLLVYSADLVLSQRSEHCTLRLEGSLGINHQHEHTLRSVDLENPAHPLAPAFRSSKALGHPIVLDTSNHTLTQFRQEVQWRGWPEPSSLLVVMPIFTNSLITGFMVMGLNPRRPYDDDLKRLVNDIWRTATSVVSSSVGFDQAQERERALTRRLTQREQFIRKVAEITNVGIYSSSAAGILTYANPKYHEIVDDTSETGSGHAFGLETFVLEEDQEKITNAIEKCKSERTNISISVRLKRKWTPPGSSTEQHYWVLNSIVPDIEDDRIQGVIGSLADIRHTMWALQLQKDSTEAALESKKHLERFIDMTSHEMRNPLGATMQCADDILRLVEDNKTSHMGSVFREIFELIQENAKTIAFCCAHQKTIADDILVVSKLSSSLLLLASAVCQPEMVAKQVVRMFQAEAANADIDLNLETHKSYAMTWALCDASRIRQILINLVSNSMKFTKGRDERCIKVIIGSSSVTPPSHMSHLQWHPKELLVPVLNDDDNIFLTFQVQDTGKGLTPEEMSRLFNRFSQANATTAATYGGSGLGLYISMQLAELQGGRIGLASEFNKGSTFGFYIRVKKTSATEEEERNLRRISDTVERQTLEKGLRQLDILVVEDNKINAKVLSKQLRAKGHQVFVANHGVEALDYIKTTRYWQGGDRPGKRLDVILMDWEMPVLNGIDCTKQIRQFEEHGSITEHLPIIVTSANARPEQIEVACSAGADGFLSKPFTVTQVLEKIQQIDL